jgi:hypothetical protein
MDRSQPPPKALIALNLMGLASFAILLAITSHVDTNVPGLSRSLIFLALFAWVNFSLYLIYKNAKYLWTRFYR